jgi:S-adenosylmethionine-dependent methyltransferase
MSQYVQNFYDQNANHEWQRLDTPLSKIEFASALWLINKYFPKQGCVCDIGSGPGRYAIELIRKGYSVTLFDLSKELIHLAQTKIAELNLKAQRFIVGDARKMEQLASESFEAVLLMGPMYHIIDPGDRLKVLKNALRILKPQGVALITYLNSWGLIRTGFSDFPTWYQDISFLRSMLNEHIFSGESLSNFTECYWSTPEIAIKEVESAGFEVVSYGGAQGFAGGMRLILEQLAEENHDAFENVVQVAAEMCELKQYRDSTEHMHLIVRKKELP